MRLLTRVLSVAGGTAALIVLASPSYAHDCFNPQKDAHAPTGGVNYTITGFGQDGPIFEQTGPGGGIGGFIAIAPGVFGPEQTSTIYVHSLGNTHSGKEEGGGPGSMKPGHNCDGKGIDYIDDCSGG
jgi:hypothetical protein